MKDDKTFLKEGIIATKNIQRFIVYRLEVKLYILHHCNVLHKHLTHLPSFLSLVVEQPIFTAYQNISNHFSGANGLL